MQTVCLIIPPSIFLLDERVFTSLGLLKVAASLEAAGHPVEVLDLSGISNYEDAVTTHVSQSKAEWYGLTATTPQMPAAARVLKAIRSTKPEAKVIFGGPHPTLVAAAYKREMKLNQPGRAEKAFKQMTDLFDTVVAGDGEHAIFEALKGDRKFIDADNFKDTSLFLTDASLEKTPYPARHLVDLNSYKYTIDGVRSTSVIAQLGCPFGCGFCMSGGTLLFTDTGFESIESLYTRSTDEKVLTCSHGGTVISRTLNEKVATETGLDSASHVILNGNKEVFALKTRNGLLFEGTEDHQIRGVKSQQLVWKSLKEFQVGDWVAICLPVHKWPSAFVPLEEPRKSLIPAGGFKQKHLKTPRVLDEDTAWLTGFILGDGCLPKDRRSSIHVCITEDVRGRLTQLFKSKFDLDIGVTPSTQTEKMEHGWIHSRAAYNFFSEVIGIDPDDKLHVPSCILKSPRSVINSFLEGLRDADGYGEYLTTADRTFAYEIANTLLLLGTLPSVHSYEHDGYTHYRVTKLGQGSVPTEKALYQNNKTGAWHWRQPRNPKSFRGIRRSTLLESGLSHSLLLDGVRYVQVESITSVGIKPVYDLHVPVQHNFVANGFIAHNCGGRESNMLRRIRTRSTQSILNELRFLYETYGYTGFMFYDDELNVSKAILELMNGIAALAKSLKVEFKLRGFVKSELFTDAQAEAMYRAGFRWILTGFESGSPRILDNINKKATKEDNDRCVAIAHKHGLKVKALMSMGHPGESYETVMDTQNWVIDNKADDFDLTIITTYPGTPYYDHAVETKPGIWTYTCPRSKDKLHALELDYNEVADYYKGDPDGGYKAYVYTDFLSCEDLIRLRGEVEAHIRKVLNIPFYPSAASVRFEHSMGQSGSALPSTILRTSGISAFP